MPEPIVIIGPAAGPAGPISRPPDAPETAAAPDAANLTEKRRAAALGAARRILGITLSVLKRAVWALATFLMWMISEYPRHSLAAAASLVILGGILYSQSGSKNSRRDVTNAISGNSPQPASVWKDPGAESKSPVAGSGSEVAGDPKASGADQAKSAVSEPAVPPKADKTETTTAQTDAAASPSLPPPQPQSAEHDRVQASLLAQAGSSEKDEQKPDAAPAPAVSALEPALVPLPAPVGEPVKATLLAAPTAPESGSPPPAPPSSLAKDEKNGAVTADSFSPTESKAAAPAPSGEQIAQTNALPEVPDDLLLPEGAPKAGEEKSKEASGNAAALAASPSGNSKPFDEPKKEASGNASALAASPSGNSKPLDEPKKIEEPTPPPIEPAAKSAGEPIAAPGSAPVTPEVVPQNPIDTKPLPAPSDAAPTLLKGINQPALAPRGAEHAQADEKSSRAAQGNEGGWIVIPNSGKVPVDPTEKPIGGPGAASLQDGPKPASAAGDSRFHASRDVDFEPEPTQSDHAGAGSDESSGRARRSGTARVGAPQPRAASHSERVDATEHVVERGENYWTISRQYWGSGRYFAALWKANEAKHPDIDGLHVGDVVVVPAIEDLHPDFILPPGKTASPEWLETLGISRRTSRRSRTSDETDRAPDSPTSGSPEEQAAGKVGRLALRPGNVPARRASQSDAELDLPDSGIASRADRSPPYKGRSAAAASVFDGDLAGDEPEAQRSARPRARSAAKPGKPAYRVRSYDTLRSIARDTLGNARRADEILELNRGVIDDPAQLVVGQILELPEDARTGIRRGSGSR